VHPNDTIKVIRQFVLDRQQTKSNSVGMVKVLSAISLSYSLILISITTFKLKLNFF
jgi:hypothetical protein